MTTDKNGKPKLLESVRRAIRTCHYSRGTEKAYVGWVRRFVRYHGLRHPAEMGADEVTAYLSHLAADRHVSASTQNQALSALLFLYRNVLEVDLPWLDGVVRAKRPQRLPTVLSRAEVKLLLDELVGPPRLVAAMLYGSGMRLAECLGLRMQDVDFTRSELMVRNGKGGKDRITMLPESLHEPLREQMNDARARHVRDREIGDIRVEVPDALARKYPRAGAELPWQ
jgi:integron integrase